MSFIGKIVSSFIQCPSCAYQFNENDLKQLSQAASAGQGAVCPSCKKSMNAKAGPYLDKSKIVPSPRLNVVRTGNTLRFSVPWFSSRAIGTLLMGAFWIGMVSFAAYIGVKNGGIKINNQMVTDPVLIYRNCALFATPGVLIFLSGIINLINKTHVVAGPGGVTWSAGPLWLLPPKHIPLLELQNISVEQNVVQNNNSRVKRVSVNAVLKTGKIKKICYLQHLQEAIYVENILETTLGLQDDQNLDAV